MKFGHVLIQYKWNCTKLLKRSNFPASVALLTELCCNRPLFCNCPLLKDISFSIQSVCWFGVINQKPRVWFGWFLGWITLVIFENFEHFFKILKRALEQFNPNRPPKHAIATNIYLLKINNLNTRKRGEICLKLNNKNTRTTSVSFWYFSF